MIHAPMPGRVIILAMAILLFSPLSATVQDPIVRYTAKQLECARFLEIGESRILTQAGGRTRRQTSSRRGVWQFRAKQAGQEVLLEGWLDSLTITRKSAETT